MNARARTSRPRSAPRGKLRPLTWHERGLFDYESIIHEVKTEADVERLYRMFVDGGAQPFMKPGMRIHTGSIWLPWGYYGAAVNLGQACIVISTPSRHGPWEIPEK